MGFVQAWSSRNTGSTGGTETISGATAGNVLLGTICVRNGADLFTTPTGWTRLDGALSDAGSTNYGFAVYARIATGDANDNFVTSFTDAGIECRHVAEYDDIDFTGGVEAVDDAFSTGDTSTATSATATSSSGRAIAVLGLREVNGWASDADGTGITTTNSFTEDAGFSGFYGLSPFVGFYSKTFSSTGAQATTISGQGGATNELVASSIFVFPAKSGGSDTDVATTSVSLSLTENSASVQYDVSVSASTATLALTPLQASVDTTTDTTVSVTTASFSLSTNTATVSLVGSDTNVSVATESLSLVTNPAVIVKDVEVNAGVTTLTLTEYQSTVSLTNFNYINAYNGSVYATGILKRWDGSEWVTNDILKRYNGSTYVAV